MVGNALSSQYSIALAAHTMNLGGRWDWDREDKGSCGCLMQGRDSEQSQGRKSLKQGLKQHRQKTKRDKGKEILPREG